ncbi:MAG: hypothetical protein WB679_16650 [Terracidiphilus sp.]
MREPETSKLSMNILDGKSRETFGALLIPIRRDRFKIAETVVSAEQKEAGSLQEAQILLTGSVLVVLRFPSRSSGQLLQNLLCEEITAAEPDASIHEGSQYIFPVCADDGYTAQIDDEFKVIWITCKSPTKTHQFGSPGRNQLPLERYEAFVLTLNNRNLQHIVCSVNYEQTSCQNSVILNTLFSN